jgi:hypothetical protein
MDIQEDNDPWGNIVGEDDPTCLDRLDYLAEGEEVVADVGDVEHDENNPNSLDRKGSSYNAAKYMAGTQAEDRRGESKEALGLQRDLIVCLSRKRISGELTLNQMLLGVMLSSSGLLLEFLFLMLVFSVGSLSLPWFLGRRGCRLRCCLRRS